MALTDLTRISTSGIATGSTIDAAILRKDVSFVVIRLVSLQYLTLQKRITFRRHKTENWNYGDIQIYNDGTKSVIENGGKYSW